MESEKSGKCFGNFLKFFDYFKIVFTFRYKDTDAYQSRFGGVIFLFFLIFSLGYFAVTFIDFVTREVYTINYSITVFQNAPEIKIQETSFMMAYALQYDNDTFADDKILGLLKQTFLFTRMDNSDPNTKVKKNIQFKKCNLSDFGPALDNKTFSALGLVNFTCPIFDANSSIIGAYTDPTYKYIELGVSVKDEVFTHDKNVTYNLDYLSRFFSENPLKIVLYWVDTAVDVREYSTPITSYIKNYVAYVDFNTIKKINMDYSLVDFSTDSNLLVQSPVSQKNVTFNQFQDFSIDTQDRLLLGSLGKTILKLFIRSSPANTIIERTYQKLTEFLANLGGLQSNILIILFLMVSFLNEFWAEQKVMNKILKFREHLKVSHPKQYEMLRSNLRSHEKDRQVNPSQVNELPLNQNKIGNFDKFTEEQEKSKRDSKDAINVSSFEMSDIKDSEAKIDVDIEDKQRGMTVHHMNIKKRSGQSLKEEEAKILANSAKPLSFSSIEIIWRHCPCKSKRLTLKNRLYEKAAVKMDYYFDIFTYVKKMQEIDLMKYLLLDKQQIKLFNFISKPSISMNYSDSDDIYQTYKENKLLKSKLEIEELEEIIKSYNNLKSRHDEINNKLFYLFDYEIDHLVIG